MTEQELEGRIWWAANIGAPESEIEAMEQELAKLQHGEGETVIIQTATLTKTLLRNSLSDYLPACSDGHEFMACPLPNGDVLAQCARCDEQWLHCPHRHQQHTKLPGRGPEPEEAWELRRRLISMKLRCSALDGGPGQGAYSSSILWLEGKLAEMEKAP